MEFTDTCIGNFVLHGDSARERSGRRQLLLLALLISGASLIGVAGNWDRYAWVRLETVVMFWGALLVMVRTRGIWGRWTNPTSVFFLFAVSDVLFCYLTTGFRVDLMINTPVVLQPFFAYSYLIIVTGLCSAIIVYLWLTTSLKRPGKQLGSLLRYLTSLHEPTIARRAALLTCVGLVLVAIGFAGEGSVPILSSDINMARYAFGEGGSAGFSHSLVRRGLAILGITVPLLSIYLRDHKSTILRVLSLAGFLSVVSSVERVLVVLMFGRFFMLDLAVGGKRVRKVFIYMCLGIPLFMVSQYVLLSSYLDKMGNVNPLTLVTVQIGELSDLAWDLSNWDFQPLYGKTYAAALIPLPETMVPFKYDHSITRLTKRLIYIPDEASFGGLRPTAFGEAFFNFLFPGTVLMGMFFGWFAAFIERACKWGLQIGQGRILPLLLFSHLWVWILIMFYQAGSNAYMDGFEGLLVIAALFGFVRVAPADEGRGHLASAC